MAATMGFANSNRTVPWKSFDTPHFEILYHDDIAPQARLARTFLEEAYAKITADLGMRERGVIITVVMTGIADESNGFSSPLGHRIILYTRPMQVMASGDIAWLKRVLAHELTHQITFLTLRKSGWGIYSELYKTQAMPDWFLEGLAQYEAESWDAKRNTFFAHVLYNSALEPYPDLATFTKDDPITGRLVYEQGHAFVRFLAARQGKRFLAKVLARVRVIPIWNEIKALLSPITASILPLEDALSDVSGETMGYLYRQFLDSMRAGLPSGTAAPRPLRGVAGFDVVYQEKFLDSSDFLFTGQRKMDQPVIALFESRAGVVRRIGPQDVNPVFDLSPDGKRIAFVRTSTDVDGDPRERLYVIGLHGEGETLISDGAAHPAFLGKDTLAFSHYAHGRQALAICELGRGQAACREEAPDSLVGFYALSRSARGLLLNATDTAGRTGIYEYAPGAGFAAVFRDSVEGEFPVEAPGGEVLMLRDRQGLLQVDALDRATGRIAPAATFPLGTFYLHRAGAGVAASVAQTGDPGHWGLRPVAIAPPAPLTALADSAGAAGASEGPAKATTVAGAEAAGAEAAGAEAAGADTAQRKSPAAGDTPKPKDVASADTARPKASESAAGAGHAATAASVATRDSVAVYRKPRFLSAPPPEFPHVDVPGTGQAQSYNSLLGIRPLLLFPAVSSTLEGGAFGATVLLQDPLQLHTLTVMGGLGPDQDAYGIDYVNQQTPAGISLSATNDLFLVDELEPPAGWKRVDLITTGTVLSAGLEIPFPSPANTFFGLGLRFTAYYKEYHLAAEDSIRDYSLVDRWSETQRVFDKQAFLAYRYLSPYAYALIHPLWEADVEAGVDSKSYGTDVFSYLRGTLPLWKELTFTAKWEMELLDYELRPAPAVPADLGPVTYFRGGRSGNIKDGYASLDFPVYKGYIGELPVLGLWNYAGAGIFGSFHRREYDRQSLGDGTYYAAHDSENVVVGAKLNGLFHIMRRVPIALSIQGGYDLDRESPVFRTSLEFSGIPDQVSLHPDFVPGVGNARRRRP